MDEKISLQDARMKETESIKAFVRNLGIDLVGIADMSLLQGIPSGLPGDAQTFLQKYPYAIVLGAQYKKVGDGKSGDAPALFLEQAAMALMFHLTETSVYKALIVHTEDEFDPVHRIGLLSLKALAKGAGLGWQGRSLLTVSPIYGPIHRLVAVLTDAPLQADPPVPNQCGDCTLCVDKCPYDALTVIQFDDHPERREDVLDLEKCRGDFGCKVCIMVCPWMKIRENKCNCTASQDP